MPPSGFNSKAVKSVTTLLRECFSDLAAEVAASKHPEIVTAIDHEIVQISKTLSTSLNDSDNQATQGVLLLVGPCYKTARAAISCGADPSAAVEQAVAQITQTIARLHIDTDGKLVEL